MYFLLLQGPTLLINSVFKAYLVLNLTKTLRILKIDYLLNRNPYEITKFISCNSHNSAKVFLPLPLYTSCVLLPIPFGIFSNRNLCHLISKRYLFGCTAATSFAISECATYRDICLTRSLSVFSLGVFRLQCSWEI